MIIMQVFINVCSCSKQYLSVLLITKIMSGTRDGTVVGAFGQV